MSICKCRRPACGEQLHTADDGYLTCRRCLSKYEVKCKNGDILRLNRKGLLPKHCSECDTNTDNDGELQFVHIYTETSQCSTGQAATGMTSTVAPTDDPFSCQNAVSHPSAKLSNDAATESSLNTARCSTSGKTKVPAGAEAMISVVAAVAKSQDDSAATSENMNLQKLSGSTQDRATDTTSHGNEINNSSSVLLAAGHAAMGSSHDRGQVNESASVPSEVHVNLASPRSAHDAEFNNVSHGEARVSHVNDTAASSDNNDVALCEERMDVQPNKTNESSVRQELLHQQISPDSVSCTKEGEPQLVQMYTEPSQCSTGQAATGVNCTVAPTEDSFSCQNAVSHPSATLGDAAAAESPLNTARCSTNGKTKVPPGAEAMSLVVAAVSKSQDDSTATENIEKRRKHRKHWKHWKLWKTSKHRKKSKTSEKLGRATDTTSHGSEIDNSRSVLLAAGHAAMGSNHDRGQVDESASVPSEVHVNLASPRSARDAEFNNVSHGEARVSHVNDTAASSDNNDVALCGERMDVLSNETNDNSVRQELLHQQISPDFVSCTKEGSSVDSSTNPPFTNQNHEKRSLMQAEATDKAKQRDMKTEELSKRNNSMHNSSSHARNTATTVDITFYVVVSQSFNFDSSCDKLFICFFTSPYDFWQEMQPTRDIKDGWSVKVSLPRHLANRGLEYKYCVVQRDKERFEGIYRNTSYGEIVNRLLRLSGTRETYNSHYRQYDIIAISDQYRPGWSTAMKSALLFGNSLSSTLAHESTHGFLCMMPDILQHLCDGKASGEEIVEQFKAVVSCAQEGRVSFLNSQRNDVDLNLLDKAIETYLQSQLENLCKLVEAVKSDEQKHLESIACATILLTLAHERSKRYLKADANYMAKVFSQLRWHNIKLIDLREMLRKQFRDFRLIREALIFSLASCTQPTKESGILAIPLYHLLANNYVDLSSHESRSSKFWGLSEPTLREFKDAIKKRNPAEWFKELRDIFAQCRLSARTFIAALALKPLMNALDNQLPLPVDGYVGAVFHYFMWSGHSEDGIAARKEREKFESTLNCLVKLAKGIQNDLNASTSDVFGREAVVAITITEEALSPFDFEISMWGCVLQIFQLLDSLETIIEKSGIVRRKGGHNNCMTLLIDKFGMWLASGYDKRKISADEIKMWEAAFVAAFQVPTTHERWMSKLETGLENRIKKISASDIVDYYYKTEYKIPKIEEIFREAALKNPDIAAFNSRNVDGRSLEKIGNVMSVAFKRAVKDASCESDWLQIMLQLAIFPNFIDLASAHSHVLDEDCQTQALTCIHICNKACSGLKEATISYSELSLLVGNSEKFLRICQLLAERKHLCDHSAQEVRRWLAVRQKEQWNFDTLKTKLRFLYSLCESLENVDVRHLKPPLDEDVKPQAIRLLWTPLLCLEQESQQLTESFFLPLANTRITTSILQKAEKVYKSLLFLHIWKQVHAEYRQTHQPCEPNELFDLNYIIDHNWRTAHERYSHLVERFNTACETFSDAEMLREHCPSHENVLKEIDIWAGSKYLSTKINQRFARYCDIRSCVAAANILKRIAGSKQLTGDFKILELIANVSMNMHRKVSDISHDDFTTIHQLKDFASIENQRCLCAFLDCQPLIECVKAQVLDPRQLKVFVDLAMINAGEGDRNVHMVTCLHTSVTGYSPLIYELPPNAGLTELLAACRSVTQSLQANPLLTQQLIDTCKNIEWVKSIKDAYGSVEVTSLSQAADFNERGIYEVGPPAGLISQKFTLDNIIRVILMSNKSQNRGRLSEAEEQAENPNSISHTYDYEHLIELQSKLMLVAGKAEQNNCDVETFVNMLRNVTRLAAALIHMHEAGSVLFDQWRARFFCDVRDGVNVHVEFGLSQKILRGMTSMSCVQHASKLADFMESCINDWNVHMTLQRQAFPELNHFTTKQIVYLRKQLMLFRLPNDVDNKVYDMVAMLHPSCNRRDIERAIVKADAQMQAAHASEDQRTNSGDERRRQLTPEEQSLVEELIAKSVNSDVAMEAVLTCPDSDIIELLFWCNERADAAADAGSLNIADKDDEGCRSSLPKFSKQLDATIRELIDEIELTAAGDNLVEQMCSLWNSFLKQVSTSMVDFLSVQHLGSFLRCLKSDCVATRPTSPRVLPPGLERGKLCLLVCPHEKVLSTVVSIYAADRDWPLPTRNEVLICGGATLLEEVELFLDRASVDNFSAYVIAHADRLNYGICNLIEKKVEDVLQYKKECFIAIVCAEEHENHSMVVTALDRFRVRNFSTQSRNILRQYIHRNLISKRTTDACHSVTADIDGCCARVVCSERAGTGKTLFVRRTYEKLAEQYRMMPFEPLVTIPLIQHEVDVNNVLDRLLHGCSDPTTRKRRMVHIDISQEVYRGVDEFLFNLLVLGSVVQQDGFVWQRSLDDYYMIEAMFFHAGEEPNRTTSYLHSILELLPTMTCLGPLQCCGYYRDISSGTKSKAADIILMDEKEFRSSAWQRTFQYLSRLDRNLPLTGVDPARVEGTSVDMLVTLIRHCGLRDPSWSELRHFVNFFNCQLRDCEISVFCSAALNEDLPGFSAFVTKFMLTMSRDFATRSLNISEESPHKQLMELQYGRTEQLLEVMEMKRLWESSPHPYLFFNPDRNTVTFLGFCVDALGNILDPDTSKVLEARAVSKPLQLALRHNRVDLSENFNKKSRTEQITKLCVVMGNERPHDPDSSYELTIDNVKKILAIHMRFRCGIPVVIMGETGCGKTRLVRFMCDLQIPQGATVKNMVLAKIHGGVSIKQLKKTVSDAYDLAKENREQYPHIDTVLFLDEANTTDAIGLIKEIMCDGTLDGQSLDASSGLRIIAAVNPYKKHSIDVIKRLETAGLGYHVHANHTEDRFGTIPMRQLVYRVRALPMSMLPLVWDFGQLNSAVEEMYIRQMVHRQVSSGKLPNLSGLSDIVARILVKCQSFMRQQKDECSFVSLRDIERVLLVMSWFYSKHHLLSAKIDDKRSSRLDNVTWSLVLALGACYHACLEPEKRPAFRAEVSQYFRAPLRGPLGEKQMLNEIEMCQTLIITSLSSHVAKDIAHNQALKENLFMMVVCIELRIPLFLIGKPGSSKSLAKAILTEAMQGKASDHRLFKEFKQTHMVSFQCSPLATPEGIVSTFRQSASLQKSRNLEEFVSVVVLDEIGLAEDSKLMPLKALHPLLEDGTDGDDIPEPYMKCAFIGISNWALDPAKMNRGILVQRGIPDQKELEDSARGICQFDSHALLSMKPLLTRLTSAYLEIFKESRKTREFFGLRDFYSLMKMIAYFASKNKDVPHPYELQHAVRRNFGGYDDQQVVQLFEKHLGVDMDVKNIGRSEAHPPCDTIGLIDSSLNGTYTQAGGEGRYLLFLTENYTALNLIQDKVQQLNPDIIFGSKFAKDLEYTQVCRNINRIKVCMELGRPVMLLNLENLYESLYDALNQYYVYFGGKRFVDLGLGTHRVKCQVHEKFRLIVVALKNVVHEKFPIPLINRLEKHYITMSTILRDEELEIVRKLEEWVSGFTSTNQSSRGIIGHQKTPGEDLVGYTSDTVATVVIQVIKDLAAYHDVNKKTAEIMDAAKYKLLLLATPDSVLRIGDSRLHVEMDHITDVYYNKQQHESLGDFLLEAITGRQCDIFVQVTTRSKLLAKDDARNIERQLQAVSAVEMTMIEALQAVETEQQFTREIKYFYETKCQGDDNSGISSCTSILLVQCDEGHKNLDLIACARHIITSEHSRFIEERKASNTSAVEQSTAITDTYNSTHSIGLTRYVVVLLIQLNKSSSFPGFHGGKWLCLHIDDLKKKKLILPAIGDARRATISQLLEAGLNQQDTSDEFSEKTLSIKENYCFDVYGLLRTCLHEAASRLRDSTVTSANSEANERSTERLKILCTIFSVNGPKALQRAFLMCIVKLLHRKELSHMTEQMALSWLKNEAAAAPNVAKSGTFRRSFEDCLRNKISPTFAAVLAYCDTNGNFDILDLSGTGDNSWATELWTDAFTNMTLSSSHLVVTLGNVESTYCHSEVPVRCNSFTGRSFKPAFPFSWILKERIDAALKQSYNVQDIHTMLSTIVTNDLDFGKHLSSFRADLGVHAVNCYAHDYIHMSQRCSCDIEHEFLLRTLKDAMKTKNMRSIAGVHICFADLQPVFSRFSRIFDIAGVLQMVDFTSRLNKEHTDESPRIAIDLHALHALLPCLEDLSKGSAVGALWANSVQLCRTVCEETLTAYLDDTSSLTADDQCIAQSCRHMWNKLLVVRLFVENIIVLPSTTSEKKPIFDAKYATTMFQYLSGAEQFDLKCLSSLQALEKFLGFCNEKLVAAIYGKNVITKTCFSCSTSMKEPVLLPCRHVICHRCLTRAFQISSSVSCPECKKNIPMGYTYSCTEEPERARYEEHLLLKKKFNAFFVRVLTEIVFTGSNQPEPLLLRHMLSYVTLEVIDDTASAASTIQRRNTKQLSPYTDVSLIDPTPVIRSFVLQLLLRSSKGLVDEYVNEYFDHSMALVQDDCTARMEFCALFVNCFEDYITYEQHPVDPSDLSSYATSMQYVLTTVKTGSPAWQLFDKPSMPLTASSLCTIAKIRLTLTIVADVIGRLSSENSTVSLPQDYLEVLNALQNLCCIAEKRANFFGLRRFLLKQIVRRHGASRIYVAMALPSAACLLPNDIRGAVGAEALCDPFAIPNNHKDTYRIVRNALSVSVVEGNMDTFTTCFQAVKKPDDVKNSLLAMTICSVIFRSYFNDRRKGVPKPETLDMLEKYVSQLPNFSSKDLIIKMLKNALPMHLELRSSTSFNDAMIALLICHLWIVLLHHKNPTASLITHLSMLLTDPRSMKGKYFPTMPHDRFQDVKEAMRGVTSEILTSYACPNGHIYFIGNCGKAITQTQCTSCSSVIGGARYNLAEGNRQVAFDEDSTKPGHILGAVDSSVQPPMAPTPERDLSPIMCSVVRTILHMTLYASAAANGPSSVKDLVSPVPADVFSFFWNHICNDFAQLKLALGKPIDDCVVLLHAIVAGLPDATASQDNINWNTHGGRSQWEASMQSSIIKDYVRNYENCISSAYETVRADAQQSSSTAILMEILRDNVVSGNTENVLFHSELWQLHKSPTLEYFAMQLENLHACDDQGPSSYVNSTSVTPKVYSRFFMRNRDTAAVIAYLPDIISLNNLLHIEYSRTLDTSAAASLSIDQFIRNQGFRNLTTLRPLVESFVKAWNTVRDELKSHRFWFCGRQCVAPAEACSNQISFDSPLTMLLAGRHGMSLCSVALATYLGKMHNEFLEIRPRDSTQNSRSAVSILNVQVPHLISFDAQRDILPIILANCEYTLRVGENAELHFNFDAIEHLIFDRFVRHKPLLLLPGTLGKANEMRLFLFRGDVTHGAQLGKLPMTTPQVAMSHNMKSKIIREYRGDQMELADSLVLIDQVIGFLLTSSVSQQTALWHYMHDTLQMSVNSKTSSVLKNCRLCHVKAVWVLLSLERIKALASDPQDYATVINGGTNFEPISSFKHFHCMGWFSCVDDRYKRAIDDDLRLRFVASLRTIRNEQTIAGILELFYEFIIVELASIDSRGSYSTGSEDDDGMQPNYPLFVTLYGYSDRTYSDNDKMLNPALGRVTGHFEQLQDDFQELLLEHAVEAWILILSTTLKQGGSPSQE